MLAYECSYTEELAHEATYMLDRLRTSDPDNRIPAKDLCAEVCLTADSIWAIYEHLVTQGHTIAFSLVEPADGILSLVKDYWMDPTSDELKTSADLLKQLGQTLMEEVEGLTKGVGTRRGS